MLSPLGGRCCTREKRKHEFWNEVNTTINVPASEHVREHHNDDDDDDDGDDDDDDGDGRDQHSFHQDMPDDQELRSCYHGKACEDIVSNGNVNL